jgi:TPR repeat protein
MKMESVTGDGLRSLVNEAESGEIESMAALGECYLFGHGVEKDEREGYKWIGKAAKDGHEFAIAREVDCLSRGMGVEQNLSLARYILEKNAEGSKASGKEGSMFIRPLS